VQGFAHSLSPRNSRKILIHNVGCDHYGFEFRPVKESLDVVKRNRTQKPIFLINDVDVLESVLDKRLCDLGKGRILREGERIDTDQILKVDLSELLFEEGGPLPFE